MSAEARDVLFESFEHEAVHFEARDVYATEVEKDRFATWLSGEPLDPVTEAEWWRPWHELLKPHKDAGHALRRLRIVSEPVTDYIRFEWLDAAELVRAGEDVRWLPRRQTSALLLPGNDFWMFDRETVVFTDFDGNGHVLDHELTTDPDIVAGCSKAFDEAWKIAIPHQEFEPA
jgi:hypothetical protein